MTDLNNINIEESTKQPSKYSNFVNNTKKAVRDTLIKTGIAASTMAPIATTTTSTVLPASVNTITAIAPTASSAISTISLGTAAGLLTACGGGEDGPDTPVNPIDKKDTVAPTINVNLSEIDITGGKDIRIDGNKLYIGGELVASRSDDKTANCNVSLSLNGKAITSGSSINDEGTLTITVKDNANNSKSIDIKLDKYKTMEITNIKPSDILPIVGQVEVGDKEAYNHIEHLRLAEATRIRDMMWEYGAGNHSKEEYQQLMMRLNTGMMAENPIGYDNYEAINTITIQPSEHAHDERNILNTIINHTNFKVLNNLDNDRINLYNLAKQDPNKINIIGLSMQKEVNKSKYDTRKMDIQKELLKEKNLILFGSGSNIGKKDGNLLNKLYQENYETSDTHSCYTVMSAANSKNDNCPDRHILITIGTNKEGSTNQTNETGGCSKFPAGFHEKVLFAGRTFPYKDISGKTIGQLGKYATSYPNYVNVAMMDICFQMFAEAKDVDELLEMIRSTTLIDYIRFDGFEPQPLQLINPAGFFQKYLMPNELPSNIKQGENIELKKGYYKGVIFDIPGTEIKINGEWIEYSEKNKSIIKAQNPMNLQWRLNGELCKKLYGEGKNIQGKIIVVDDKWNGLNINKEFYINIQ